MNTLFTLESLSQTLLASVMTLGIIKVALIIFVIAFLTRLQPVLGLIGAFLFIAYLLHWI